METEVAGLEQKIRELNGQEPRSKVRTPADEVEAALSLLDQILRVTADESARAEIPKLIQGLGIWIGLSFGEAIKGKKRVVRRLQSGVMVFGDAELPVHLHGRDRLPDHHSGDSHNATEGCTPSGRDRIVTGDAGTIPASPDSRPNQCHREGISFTKVNRDDRN